MQTLVRSRAFGETREKDKLVKVPRLRLICAEAAQRRWLDVEHRAIYCSTWKLEAE